MSTTPAWLPWDILQSFLGLSRKLQLPFAEIVKWALCDTKKNKNKRSKISQILLVYTFVSTLEPKAMLPHDHSIWLIAMLRSNEQNYSVLSSKGKLNLANVSPAHEITLQQQEDVILRFCFGNSRKKSEGRSQAYRLPIRSSDSLS